MNGFNLWVGLGASLGLWRVARSVPQQQAGAWANTGLFVLLLSLVGARLFYVLAAWSYFSTHLLEAPQLWLGGLTWPGAVGGAAAAILFLAFNARAQRSSPRESAHRPAWLPLGWLGDRLYPMLPPVAITAWLGSWQAGAAYGPALPQGSLLGVPSLDDSGAYTPHLPLQLLAALSLLIFFWVLELRVKPLRPAGRLSGLAVFGLLLNLLAASLLRADSAPYWNGLRSDAWFALLYLALFVTITTLNSLLYRLWKKSSLAHHERLSS